MDRTIFFNAIRRDPFGGSLSDEQVAGITDILDVWDRGRFTDLRWLAYILGGVFHEVGRRMVPVREGFAKTDAGARQAVAKLHQSGRISRNYALPNAAGVSFYGRGRIQNTHEKNYQKLERRFGHPFTYKPDLLLDSKIDAEVTVYGHIEGIWTGKKLSDYFNAKTTDWVNARKIVNGLDKAATIAKYARAFYAALNAAATGDHHPADPIVLPPPPTMPRPPDDENGDPTYPHGEPARRGAWIITAVVLIAIVIAVVLVFAFINGAPK